MGELKRGSTVIIQTAYQAIVELKLDSNRLQDLLHLREMLAARLIQELADPWQFFDDGLIRRHFAIEHSQRIGNGAALAVGAHLSDDRLERLAQSFVVDRAISGTTDGIQLQSPVFDAKAVEQSRQQFQNLGVARRRFAARAG